MTTNSLESLLYQLSSVFLWPALLLIITALCYTLFSTGRLMTDAWLRHRGKLRGQLSLYAKNSGCTGDDLELWIIRRLELLRLTSCITPLLGLVATLIIIVRNPLNPFSSENVVVVENPGQDNMTITIKEGKEMTRYESSGDIGEGNGVKAGITYKLPDGKMIYVPE